MCPDRGWSIVPQTCIGPCCNSAGGHRRKGQSWNGMVKSLGLLLQSEHRCSIKQSPNLVSPMKKRLHCDNGIQYSRLETLQMNHCFPYNHSTCNTFTFTSTLPNIQGSKQSFKCEATVHLHFKPNVLCLMFTLWFPQLLRNQRLGDSFAKTFVQLQKWLWASNCLPL